MIYNFIWNDNQEKVKRETMNTNYIDKYVDAIQINWVKKFANKNCVYVYGIFVLVYMKLKIQKMYCK